MATFGTGNYQYEVVEGWGMIPQLGLVSGVACDVTVDHYDRVYILDRGNLRCQIFNNDREFLTEWMGLGSPDGLFIDSDNFIHIAEARQRICIMTVDGEVIGRWGKRGTAPGQFSDSPHGIWIDSRGDIYFSEVIAEKRFQKFARV